MIYLDNRQETQTVAIDINTDAGQYFPIVPEEPNMYYTQVQVDNKFTNYYDKEQTYSKGEVYNTNEVDTQVFSLRRSVETTKEEVETDLSVEVNRLDKRVDDVEFKVDNIDMSDYYKRYEIDEKFDNIDLSGAEGGAYILEYVGDYDEQWWDGVDWETYEMINYPYADSDRQTHNADIFQKVKNGDVKALYYKMPSGTMVEVEDEEKSGIRTINEWKYVPAKFEFNTMQNSVNVVVSEAMTSYVQTYTIEIYEFGGLSYNQEDYRSMGTSLSDLKIYQCTPSIESSVSTYSGQPRFTWTEFQLFLKNVQTSNLIYVRTPLNGQRYPSSTNGIGFLMQPWNNDAGDMYLTIIYGDVDGKTKKAVFHATRNSDGTYTTNYQYKSGMYQYIRPMSFTEI